MDTLSTAKRSFLSLLVLFNLSLCLGQADNESNTGNWTDGATWSAGVPVDGVEGDENILYIPAGEVVDLYDQITLNDVILVIAGELIMNFNWTTFQYSNLSLQGTNAAIIVEDGGQITDGSAAGLGNYVQVNDEEFWGGQFYNAVGGNASNTGNFTSSGQTAEPPSASNPLPVELISFTSEYSDGHALLIWETASELNNNGYEIEFSSDGSQFHKIGFVKGHGTSTEFHRYSFDYYPNQSGYYRLKQLDFDGNYEYSQIRYLEVTLEMTQFKVYPNPMRDKLHLQGALSGYALFDQQGRLLIQQSNITSREAENEINKILSEQTEGRYLLVSELNGRKQTSQIIKK